MIALTAIFPPFVRGVGGAQPGQPLYLIKEYAVRVEELGNKPLLLGKDQWNFDTDPFPDVGKAIIPDAGKAIIAISRKAAQAANVNFEELPADIRYGIAEHLVYNLGAEQVAQMLDPTQQPSDESQNLLGQIALASMEHSRRGTRIGAFRRRKSSS